MKRTSGDKPADVIEISDDDSPSKQPPQKVVRKEAEQFNSPVILGIHENLVKMEKDYQHACRTAEEAQKRVAFLKNFLEKNPGASDDTEKEELKKRLTEVSAKLEDSTRKIGEMSKNDCEKAQEIDKLKTDIVGLKREQQLQLQSQNERLAETSAELEKAKREVAIREFKLKKLDKLEKDFQGVCRIANEYEMGMNEAKARVIELENIIDKKPIIAPMVIDDPEKNLVAELRAKLVATSIQLEHETKSKQQLQESVRLLTQRLEAKQARAKEEPNSREIRIEQNRLNMDDLSVPAKVDAMQAPLDPPLIPPRKTPVATASPNLCEPTWREGSIPFEDALDNLRSRYHPSDEEWLRNCKNVLSDENHKCTLCKTGFLSNVSILRHFFSNRHIHMMRDALFTSAHSIISGRRARSAGVHQAALDYWMAKLNSIPKPTPAEPAAAPDRTPIIWNLESSIPEIRKGRNPEIPIVNTAALKRFLPQGRATARTTTIIKKEPTRTPKVAARTITAVVYPTVAEGTPATKAQVATVAPTVTAPIEAAEVAEVLNPVSKEGTDLDGKKDCSMA